MLNAQIKTSRFHGIFITSLLTVFLFFQAATIDAADREDPLVAFKFGLEIEGKLSGYFDFVSNIGSKSKVIEQKVTDPDSGETIIHKSPGRLIWLNVNLRRGLTSSMDIWDWRQLVISGNIADARTNCSIIAYNQSNLEIARWNLENVWPKKVAGPVMNEDGVTSYMIEEVVLVHEGAERIH